MVFVDSCCGDPQLLDVRSLVASSGRFQRQGSLMKKTVRIILLTLGLALFAWFIQRTGWDDIRDTFKELGWFGLVALIPYTIVFTIDRSLCK